MEAVIGSRGSLHEYGARHEKVIVRKRIGRSVIKKIIAVELILAAVLCYIFVNISLGHIYAKRSAALITDVSRFNTATVTTAASESFKKAREAVKEVRDETVWMKNEANYRTGPDTTYEKLGSMFKYAAVYRTGITYNGWSQVEIDGKEAYIKSRNITTEAPPITATGQKGQYQLFALSQLASYGWSESEIYPLIKLWDRESGWNPRAHNGGSGAHGIPQALPASKMAAYGSDYYTNGNTQILWGLNYIANRYGSPSGAWGHFCSSGWY